MSFCISIVFLSLLTPCFPVLTTIQMTKSLEELVISVSNTWNVVNSYGDFAEVPFDKRQRLIMTKIGIINRKLEEMDNNIGELENDIATISSNLLERLTFERHKENFNQYKNCLSSYYDNMKKYASNIEDYEKFTLIDFSNYAVSHHNHSMSNLPENIYQQIEQFLKLLHKQLRSKDHLCHLLSPQQIVYNVLNTILMANLKGYITVQFAYMVKKLYGQGNVVKEASDATEEFKIRTDAIIETVKRYMVSASTEIWKCDPTKHIPGETYLEITSLLQGFILNKANLDERGECIDSCDSYIYVEKPYCRDNVWCNKYKDPECPRIFDCRLVDDEMEICMEKNYKSGRRYKYVEHANGPMFGKKTYCNKSDMRHLRSYRYWLFFKCQYCFCLCDYGQSNRYSDRYINLRRVMANIDDNRVVTGIRFVKHNRIIHLQVQEGRLLPGGQIDSSTIRWVPPENYTVIDRSIYEGQDFHVLTWEKRDFDLNTVMADEGSLVTGVRFRMVGTRVDLEVWTTPFNFTTGQLIQPNSRSFFKDSPNLALRHKFNSEVKLYKPDIPTRSIKPSIPDPSTFKHVRFVNTDYEKDAAQSTVPFFDAQKVESSIPAPLSGVGVYFKGNPGSGGFIAPKIFTYDFSQHLEPVFSLERKRNRL